MRLEQERPHKSSMERILVETRAQIVLSSGVIVSGYTVDLSIGGVYVRSQQSLHCDDLVQINLAVPSDDPILEISCQARTAWINDDDQRLKLDYPPGAGLEFMALAPEKAADLSEFIDAYDAQKKMNMVCAWCGKSLGLRKGPHGRISHGICGSCRELYF